MKAVLLIADGMGFAPAGPGNAVTAETMPLLFDLARRNGLALLDASGPAVGQDAGQVGNSEVGHLTIGAGTTVLSALASIDAAYRDGSWAAHALWRELAGARLHLVGLLSDAGIHGHLDTMIHAAAIALDRGIGEVIVHPVLDGVDSPARSAPLLLRRLESELGRARLGCVIGRRWACDRSGDRAPARHVVACLTGAATAPPFSAAALAAHLERGKEADFPGHRAGPTIAAGEPVLLTNHRADRTASLSEAFAEERPTYGVVELGAGVKGVFFPTRPRESGLARELSVAGSVRIAESCKFPHVTRFLNGFHERLGERAVCVPSLPEAELAARPEMSAAAVVEAALAALHDETRAALVVNLANLDQIGHLGDLALATRAAAVVDRAIGELDRACRAAGCGLLVTADHGNAETMIDASGAPFGGHTRNPVPFVVGGAEGLRLRARHGTLANVAATLLTAAGIAPPPWMAPSLCARDEVLS